MGASIKFNLVLLQSLLICNNILGLITVPVRDDLLGPGQCPTGSFCTETNSCTKEYYITKSGLPFYCGAHHSIDAKICCLTPNADTQERDKIDQSLPPIEIKNDNENDREAFKRSYRNSQNAELEYGSDEDLDDDDETDVQSIPFSDSEETEVEDSSFPARSPEFDQGQLNPFDNLESLVEKENEQELNTLRKDRSFPNESSDDNELSEEATSSDEDHEEKADNKMMKGRSSGPLEKSKLLKENSVEENQSESNFERKENLKEYLQRSRSTPCACEKGEKGEPGPRGEAGEPGKIIYIPVFIDSSSGLVLDQNVGLNNYRQFTPSQEQFGNMKQHRPARNNAPPTPPPHSINPLVIPYNVPLNSPKQHSKPLPPHIIQNSQPPTHIPTPTVIQSPPPMAKPVNGLDDKQEQDRLTRHTMTKTLKRFQRAK